MSGWQANATLCSSLTIRNIKTILYKEGTALKAIKAVLVEDQRGVNEALKRYLERQHGIECLASFFSMEELLAALDDGPVPDVVITDLELKAPPPNPPGMDGCAGALELRRRHKRIPIILYSGIPQDDVLERWSSLHLTTHYGLLTRSALMVDSLGEIIHRVVRGEAFIDPELQALAAQRRTQRSRSPWSLLEDDDQRTVLKLLADGLTNTEIARTIGYSNAFVEKHVGEIYDLLQVNNVDARIARVRAARMVWEDRLLIWQDDSIRGVVPMTQDEQGDWVSLDMVKEEEQIAQRQARVLMGM